MCGEFMMLTLYDYYRSTASYRVRIALNLKGIDYDSHHVDLKAGAQLQTPYKKINPQALVPSLTVDGDTLSQSLAILEYLEETYPEKAILPEDSYARAKVRMLSMMIACEIHPLNNLRVLKYLVKELKVGESDKIAWYHHWLKLGFDALEVKLSNQPSKKDYCVGQSPTMADICLVPQIYNANRFEFSMDAYPILSCINQQCLSLDAFRRAHPDYKEC